MILDRTLVQNLIYYKFFTSLFTKIASSSIWSPLIKCTLKLELHLLPNRCSLNCSTSHHVVHYEGQGGPVQANSKPRPEVLTILGRASERLRPDVQHLFSHLKPDVNTSIYAATHPKIAQNPGQWKHLWSTPGLSYVCSIKLPGDPHFGCFPLWIMLAFESKPVATFQAWRYTSLLGANLSVINSPQTLFAVYSQVICSVNL